MDLGVSLDDEPYLLPLVQQMRVLPPGWNVVEGAHHRPLYVSDSGEKSAEHPARHWFESQLPLWRQQATNPPPTLAEPAAREPWLEGALPPPNPMLFRAWFEEGTAGRTSSVRRDVILEHFPQTGEFSVQVHGSNKRYVVPVILSKKGLPLTHLDLFVGAVVDVLGRPTTLRQAANVSTSSWIEGEAKRLAVLTETLSAELRKYGVNARGSSTAPKQHVDRRGVILNQSLAGTHLRLAQEQLEHLFYTLDDLRPKAAQAWAAAAERQGMKRQQDAADAAARESRRRLAAREQEERAMARNSIGRRGH